MSWFAAELPKSQQLVGRGLKVLGAEVRDRPDGNANPPATNFWTALTNVSKGGGQVHLKQHVSETGLPVGKFGTS